MNSTFYWFSVFFKKGLKGGKSHKIEFTLGKSPDMYACMAICMQTGCPFDIQYIWLGHVGVLPPQLYGKSIVDYTFQYNRMQKKKKCKLHVGSQWLTYVIL